MMIQSRSCQGPPALCVLCMSCNRKPRRDESSSTASGPDEVLELAHVVTTKPQSRTWARVGGVKVPDTSRVPRRNVARRKLGPQLAPLPGRRTGYLATAQYPVARLSAPRVRGYVHVGVAIYLPQILAAGAISPSSSLRCHCLLLSCFARNRALLQSKPHCSRCVPVFPRLLPCVLPHVSPRSPICLPAVARLSGFAQASIQVLLLRRLLLLPQHPPSCTSPISVCATTGSKRPSLL
ncbi:hypothetical protein B0T14DRAFT_206053 [Immersiella caudata]|uniref:Uncharacterized protein n=1 Tax=Immersiella caudata TaxID=314043 RepID=A0AA40BZ50_9PEZI|nr:hypothetical protein B0T14DRAFT_206053 [Immersiella caudata]